MNCYTVVGGGVPEVGIAVTSRCDNPGYAIGLRLGEKTEQPAGRLEIIPLHPSEPASRVWVAGGIGLVRTAKLLRSDPHQFFLAHAKHGLRPDTSDQRALVLVDFWSTSNTAGYIPKTYEEIPVQGFKVERGLYRLQSLVILKPGQHFLGRNASTETSFVISLDFDPKKDRTPRLSCVPPHVFRSRKKEDLVEV